MHRRRETIVFFIAGVFLCPLSEKNSHPFLFHLLNVGITTDRVAAQMYSYGRSKQGGHDNE